MFAKWVNYVVEKLGHYFEHASHRNGKRSLQILKQSFKYKKNFKGPRKAIVKPFQHVSK